MKQNNIVFDESINFGEDRIFNYEYLRYSGPIDTIQECFLHYRHINPSSLSTGFIHHYIDTALFLHYEKMKYLPLADAVDKSAKDDFTKYDFEKEVKIAEQMIESNKDNLSKAEYDEEMNYLKNKVNEHCDV